MAFSHADVLEEFVDASRLGREFANGRIEDMSSESISRLEQWRLDNPGLRNASRYQREKVTQQIRKRDVYWRKGGRERQREAYAAKQKAAGKVIYARRRLWRITDDDRRSVVCLKGLGVRTIEVCKVMQLSKQTVCRIMKGEKHER